MPLDQSQVIFNVLDKWPSFPLIRRGLTAPSAAVCSLRVSTCSALRHRRVSTLMSLPTREKAGEEPSPPASQRAVSVTIIWRPTARTATVASRNRLSLRQSVALFLGRPEGNRAGGSNYGRVIYELQDRRVVL